MRSDAIASLNVSRETVDRLQIYQNSLQRWNQHINLVSKGSEENSWIRHLVDSAQLLPFSRESDRTWVDLGSGAGFPGLVTAIIAKEKKPNLKIILVEADQRKCTFLRTILRETNTSAKVVAARIEELPSLDADVLSARALAPLKKLLEYAKMHRNPKGRCLFMKGETWLKEIEEAQRSWTFSMTAHKSITHPKAAVLEIGTFDHV